MYVENPNLLKNETPPPDSNSILIFKNRQILQLGSNGNSKFPWNLWSTDL
jgi:hypothetical protein